MQKFYQWGISEELGNERTIFGKKIIMIETIQQKIKDKLMRLYEKIFDFQKKTEISDEKYINEKIKNKEHLQNWFRLRKEKKMYDGQLVPVSSSLEYFVEEKMKQLPSKFFRQDEINEDQYLQEQKETEEFEAQFYEDYNEKECNECGITLPLDSETKDGLCEDCRNNNDSLRVWENENSDF